MINIHLMEENQEVLKNTEPMNNQITPAVLNVVTTASLKIIELLVTGILSTLTKAESQSIQTIE